MSSQWRTGKTGTGLLKALLIQSQFLLIGEYSREVSEDIF